MREILLEAFQPSHQSCCGTGSGQRPAGRVLDEDVSAFEQGAYATSELAIVGNYAHVAQSLKPPAANLYVDSTGLALEIVGLVNDQATAGRTFGSGLALAVGAGRHVACIEIKDVIDESAVAGSRA